MRKSVLVAMLVAACALGLLSASAWVLLGAGGSASKPIAGGTAANVPGAVRDGLRECVTLSSGEVGTFSAGMECYKGVLRSALQNDRYDEVLAMYEELGFSDTGPVCHNAGHQLGLELTEAGWRMEEVLARMFHGVPQAEPEYSCTTPLVHGLIQGNTVGPGPYEMEYLAAQCLGLERIHVHYANECAHYYGHATWNSVKEISPRLAELCAKLAPGVESDAENSCMGGAVMTSYGLQEGYGADDVEVERKPTPSYVESTRLCDPLAGGREESYLACWGGAGWLLAMEAIQTLGEVPSDTVEGRQRAVAEYVKAINYCKGNLCLDNFITHFRLGDYHDGVVKSVCLSPDLNPEFDMEHMRAACDQLMQRRAGLSLDGPEPLVPAPSAAPANPSPSSAGASAGASAGTPTASGS